MKNPGIPFSSFIIGLSAFLLSSCMVQAPPGPVIIGISKALPEQYYGNYAKWIGRADTGIICIDLYHMPIDSALLILNKCSGLILSGGPDVFPGRYEQAHDTVKCDPIDHFRDSLEWSLISRAIEMEMPVLGICRGLQIFNVYHGGSLFPDIPTDLDTLVKHRCEDVQHCYHAINGIPENSLLSAITDMSDGIVNSNHHQGINRLGAGLAGIARSDDGLIECIEYQNRENLPFFLGVQWHPERMDTVNPFSMPIARAFVNEVRQYQMGKEEKR